MANEKSSKTFQEALTLVLLYLGSWQEGEGDFFARRSWKGYNFDCLDFLTDNGFIYGNKRNKSVYFTDEGVAAARRMLASLEESSGSQLSTIMHEVSKPQGSYLLKVEFDFEELICWREVWVPTKLTFFDLHFIIQSLLNWLDYHWYDFRAEVGGESLKLVEVSQQEDTVDDFDDEIELADVEVLQLRDVFAETSTVRYSYDYGDGWELIVTMVEHDECRTDERVVCVGGAGDNPPDDVGGEGGFIRFLQAISDPANSDHVLLSDWGKSQGYFEYSLEAANAHLAQWQSNERIHVVNIAKALR